MSVKFSQSFKAQAVEKVLSLPEGIGIRIHECWLFNVNKYFRLSCSPHQIVSPYHAVFSAFW